jgi:CheY-like chemotaxis protein
MDPKKRAAVILLVEDNQMDIELTLDAFRQVNLEESLHVVRTGEQALQYMLGQAPFADRQAHPQPDLVLMDLKLPGLNGLEVVAKLKTTPQVKRIPIVVLTSSREEGDLLTSYENGANSYLIKPVTFKDFLEVVTSLENYWLNLNVTPPKIS